MLVTAAGLVARLIPAWRYFLNPDEALHYLLADQSSFRLAYKAALTNAHPPLLILLLYFWRGLGRSEFVLRLPSVLAGTACCWLIYQWLKLVSDRATARVGLILFALAPQLIWISAEIRQYALLLFFASGCLYLAERALRENSATRMVLFSLSLYGALLTHYSSYLFAFVIGIYMLVRLYRHGNARLWGVWAAGQAGGAAIAVYYLVTHVSRLKATGMIRGTAETFVRKSLFHPDQQHVLSFIGVQTLRFFTYLFSHGVVGTLLLIAFAIGMALLMKNGEAESAAPTSRQLALLLGLPFVLDCASALAGAYPYGGTRHCLVLAPFAIGGASVALARLAPSRLGTKCGVIIAVLLFCNLFPAPPPMIRPRNQRRAWMVQALDSLRQAAPPGSIIVTAYESGLLLGYYACGHGIVQEFPPFVSFAKSECGSYTVMTARPERWKFYANDLQDQLAEMASAYGLAPGAKVWLFDAGWITDSAPALRKEWCSAPRSFGENIFYCQVTVGGR